jgi:hypothetical protein
MRYFVCLLLTLWGLNSQAQTLHLVLVSDVEDMQFGPVSLSDEYALTKLSETVKSYLDYKLNIVYLNRANFTSKAILKTLDTLKTQPNDLIIWHYSGLGFYPSASRSKYPSFKLKDFLQSTLSLDDVAARITKKGVRLAWVMADLRNTFPDDEILAAPLFVVEDIRKLVIEKLFLEPCGIMKLVSSQRNQPTYTNIARSNSIFVLSLKKSFDDILYNTMLDNINRISLDSLLRQTQAVVSGELSGAIPANTTQTMQWELVPCSVALKAKISPVRSFEGLATQDALLARLNSLVLVVDPSERRPIIASIRALFEPNATIRLSTRNAPGRVEFGLEAFLQSLSKHNPQLSSYTFGPHETTRGSDMRQFKSLNLTQIVKN